MSTPAGTYRVQVRPKFGFAMAGELAGYLADLGVTHLYSAPMLQAAPGSEHNYDVVDPARANDQLGGDAGRRELVAALRAKGLGLVADIVPNHLGVADAAANPYWWDVLAHGRESRYASWFDVDWSRGRLLLPVLGDDPEALRLDGRELRYHEHRFPIAPGTGEGTAAEVHARQHYQLVNWRRAATDLNYRRFFAVSTLAGLRIEDPAVFDATHAEVLRWYADGDLDGIRVDHPDGLRDPTGYLRRLREAAPGAWLVAEKIVEPGEELPPWPIEGTTGYEALREVCGLFVDPAAEPAFTALDIELTGVKTEYADLLFTCKRDVATGMMRAELSRLGRLADGIPDAEDALADLAACFPVYRSYLPEYGSERLREALRAARRRSPGYDFGPVAKRLRDSGDELAIRFQQFTGAVMAKGVEDTAFYRWTRFVALNEVGGDPSRFGVTPGEFHAAAGLRQDRWPAMMTTLSTHDTKRGEDVRARLAVLSELPSDWADLVRRLTAAAPLSDGSLAHLLWQTAVGAWPIERDRLHAYLEKAAREARTATGWDDPDTAFEEAMHAVADRCYDDPAVAAEVAGFAARITPYGWSNSLGQKLVQLAGPGVPDVYQGTELWENSLVDPDNRRDVDFGARRSALAALDSGLPPVDPSGAAKLLVTTRALRLRRDRPDLFTGYTPIAADGPSAAHAVAFDRGGAIAVATRLPVGLDAAGGWHGTTLALPEGTWTDVLTGREFGGGPAALEDLLGRYPVALLARN
ncbi:MAG: (1-_4)-alpha-D-glucan 1-alpha-D-glucosylmutase [Cryptosporangiaceae bacterium]|nr:(1->4)-alpha-D-glucan 1-alpha-D-glucosylmutase [Cryptosporangiaceae bacterium]